MEKEIKNAKGVGREFSCGGPDVIVRIAQERNETKMWRNTLRLGLYILPVKIFNRNSYQIAQ